MRKLRHESPRFDRYSYLLSGIKRSEPLSTKQIKTVFLILPEDYLNGYLDVQTFESTAGDLYYNFSKSPNTVNSEDPVLGQTLDYASDITYYQNKKAHLDKINKALISYHETNNNLLHRKNNTG